MVSVVARAGVAAVVAAVGLVACGGGREEPGAVESGSPGVTRVPPVEVSPSVGAREGKVARPKIPAGTRVGYVVYDRRSGRVTLRHNAHGTVRSASVVKILIALDYLERLGERSVPAGDLALLRPMLRSSDDGAATALWRRGGQRAIVARMARKLGLKETEPPPASQPGFWGYSAISAADMVTTYRYVMEKARPKVRSLIVGELRKATRCGVDRFDQYFGIPRAVPKPWAVKQGWSGFGDVPVVPCRGGGASANGASVRLVGAPDLGLGRPVLHTTGLVGDGDRWIVVVLSLHPAGSSFQAAATRLTGLTRQVYAARGGS